MAVVNTKISGGCFHIAVAAAGREMVNMTLQNSDGGVIRDLKIPRVVGIGLANSAHTTSVISAHASARCLRADHSSRVCSQVVKTCASSDSEDRRRSFKTKQ